MTLVVLTKWVDVPFGDGKTFAKAPACIAVGNLTYTDVTGQDGTKIDVGHFLLCQIETDQATADKIEAQGLGTVLWSKGDAALDAGKTSSIVAKLTGYGVDAATADKVKAGTPLDTIKDQVVAALDAQAPAAKADAMALKG